MQFKKKHLLHFHDDMTERLTDYVQNALRKNVGDH